MPETSCDCQSMASAGSKAAIIDNVWEIVCGHLMLEQPIALDGRHMYVCYVLLRSDLHHVPFEHSLWDY